MPNLAHPLRPGKRSAATQHSPTIRERTLFARLPLAVAEVTDPADRRALGALVEARLALLAIGQAGEIVAARRWA